MQHAASLRSHPVATAASPWSLPAWPPLLWQAAQASGLRLHHLGTRVVFAGDDPCAVCGHTMWAASAAEGEAGVAWDWVQIAQGVVAMADPMAVVTNLRLLSDDGVELDSCTAALYLNAIVHALPWQHEVARALASPQ